MLRLHPRLWTLARSQRLSTALRFITPLPAATRGAGATERDQKPSISLPPPPGPHADPAPTAPSSTDDADLVKQLRQDLDRSLDSEKPKDDNVFASAPSQHASSSSDPIGTPTLPQSPTSKETPTSSQLDTKPHDSTSPLSKTPDEFQERLRTWSERTKERLSTRADAFTASALTTFSQLGGKLNQFTGYEEIEQLKRMVVKQEEQIQMTRAVAREAKQILEKAVAARAASQREVNDLLSRKSTWSDEDVGRFTRLVREDHAREQAESAALAAATAAEDAVEREFDALMRAILSRYHEEQVWSDKIRSASTYGSLAVLGLNLLVFVLATVFVEPWKRRRLAATFEAKVERMDAKNTALIEDGIGSLVQRLDAQERALAAIGATAGSARSSETDVGPTQTPTTIAQGQVEMTDVPAEDASPPSVPVWRVPWSIPPRLEKHIPPWVPEVPPEQAWLIVSTVAFVGGSLAGWLMRELRN